MAPTGQGLRFGKLRSYTAELLRLWLEASKSMLVLVVLRFDQVDVALHLFGLTLLEVQFQLSLHGLAIVYLHLGRKHLQASLP